MLVTFRAAQSQQLCTGRGVVTEMTALSIGEPVWRAATSSSTLRTWAEISSGYSLPEQKLIRKWRGQARHSLLLELLGPKAWCAAAREGKGRFTFCHCSTREANIPSFTWLHCKGYLQYCLTCLGILLQHMPSAAEKGPHLSGICCCVCIFLTNEPLD